MAVIGGIGILSVLCILICGGLVTLYFAVQPTPQTAIVGEWEIDDGNGRFVFTFEKDGTITATTDGYRLHGKYKFLSANRIDLEFDGLPLTGGLSIAGTFKLSFPETDRMRLTNETTGISRVWRRVKK
jgi:hypothetical protein